MKAKETLHPIPGLSREAEEAKLAEIIGIAQDNLTKTEHAIKQLSADVNEVYDQMEEAGSEAKHSLAMLHNTQSQLYEQKRELLRCQKARKKPYFGRIDFKDKEQPHAESYYVGRVGITKTGAEPVVIDWRAPVASVYYENATGICTYMVKNEGRHAIDLKRKRTYEIAEDKLVDFFDSDVVATDELLNKFLAKSKKAVLSEIIATIQKEQNAVIRKSPKTNIIVQGVAGSGKTTVAMHRISYILYNYEERFRPQDFYIIGSNRILLDYITGVLPDLDVYGIAQMTMEQLFVRLLYEDWDSNQYSICPVDLENSSACMKGSYDWFHDLEQFCSAYELAAVPAAEVRLEKNGVLFMRAHEIKSYLEQNPQASMQSKINMLNEILLARLENELSGRHVSYSAAEKKQLHKTYRWHFGKDVWKGSIFELYKEFLQAQRQKGKFVPETGNAFDVYDLAALAYLYKRIKETDGIREASHVIIDEAQDFGMMAYGALAYCMRGCTYTIMGDVSQNINYGYGLNDWEQLQGLILKGTYDSFCLLKKSYRNTVEISEFATEILRHGDFSIYPVEPIKRHGNRVQVLECKDEAAMVQEMAQMILSWCKQGHETAAVICRDEREALTVTSMLQEALASIAPAAASMIRPMLKGSADKEAADSGFQTAEFGNGIMVLPIAYTKGLEFDAVLIYNPSAGRYPAKDQYVKLLYVAATRALHELAVVHQGDLTDLIRLPVSGEKRMRSLENQVKKEARQYAKQEFSAKEQAVLKARQGDIERALRDDMGPKPIVVQKAKKEGEGLDAPAAPKQVQGNQGQKLYKDNRYRQPGMPKLNGTAFAGSRAARNNIEHGARSREDKNNAPINTSPYPFKGCPDASLLRPMGHSRIDCSVRIIKKTKKYADLISSYGTLRLTPMEDALIRVQFVRGAAADFEPGYWNYQPQQTAVWTVKEGKNLAEISTGKVTVKIEKKTGALQFFDNFHQKGKLLLEENAALPRQIETEASKTWVYFDWPKKEALSVKGILKDDLERMNQKARFISFGGRKLRMPLLVSDFGYGIGVAAEKTAMCCTIPMYGSYLYTDGAEQIDYYFLYGEDYGAILEMYQKLV